MASSPITSWEIEGEKVEAVTDFLFLDSKITADGDYSHEIKRPLLLGRKGMTNLDSVEKQRLYSADKDLYSQSYGLPSGHVWLCELDHKEGRPPKNWCLRTVVLEKTPDSSLETGGKAIKPINLKGDESWIFTGKTDAEAEASVFWSSDAISWSTGKLPDTGKDWEQKEKRASENEMVGQNHWCDEHELGLMPGDGEGQGGLACCSPWGHKESDMTGQLNNNKWWQDWIQEF